MHYFPDPRGPSLAELLIVALICGVIALGAAMAFGQDIREGRKFWAAPRMLTAKAAEVALPTSAAVGVARDAPAVAGKAMSLEARELAIRGVEADAAAREAAIAVVSGSAKATPVASMPAGASDAKAAPAPSATAAEQQARASSPQVPMTVADLVDHEFMAANLGLMTFQDQGHGFKPVVLRSGMAEAMVREVRVAVASGVATTREGRLLDARRAGRLGAAFWLHMGGATADAHRYAAEAGFEQPGPVKALPQWFVALNAGDWAGHQHASKLDALAYPVQTVRFALSEPRPDIIEHVQQRADRRFLVIADETVLDEKNAALFTQPNVFAIVVGHYYSADPEHYRPTEYVQRIRSTIALLRRVTDTPILLAIPWTEFETYRSGRFWVQEIGDLVDQADGYAVFHMISFAALEGKTAVGIARQLGLPAGRPMVLLDFAGFTSARAEATGKLWRERGDQIIGRMRSAGWRGVVFVGPQDDAVTLKSELFSGLQPDNQFEP